MTKELWINLPVKDIARSTAFYKGIGFTLNEKYGNSDVSASFMVGSKNIILMLFTEPVFQGFVRHEIADPKQSSSVLFSIDAESREEIDGIAAKAEKLGGTVFGKPGENQGWMYGCGFTDPDGHRWNGLYMDFSKMPK